VNDLITVVTERGQTSIPARIRKQLNLLPGQIADLKRFLIGARIGWEEPWTLADTETSHGGWWRYVSQKRQGSVARRPVADLLIGGFASRFRRLITRNPADFKRFYPALTLISP